MKTPQRVALIGHRGVGKTSLLSRIEKYYQSDGRRARVFDLDREIEQAAGRSVSQIFQDDGEAVFRRLELTTFEKLTNEITRSTDDVYVACGAGFSVAHLSPSWRALWIRRVTDESGRIFTDRPRLDAKLSALEEFITRLNERTPKFAKRADEVLILDEGIEDAVDTAERDFFLEAFANIGGALTLTSDNFSAQFETWAQRRLQWGVKWFELRDDLLSEAQISRALQVLPTAHVLFSFRDRTRQNLSAKTVEANNLAFDWPTERGPCPISEPRYLSLHERVGNLSESLERLTQAGRDSSAQLKAALPTESFDDLKAGHLWQQADPQRRIFLPMSSDGRWAWYRLLRSQDYSLNFFRESTGSAPDQPTLLQWVRRKKLAPSQTFAAVLGDPVAHSRTPMEQAAFFAAQQESVLSIHITKDEWPIANPFLAAIGLRSAAVTAPLKKLAFETLGETRCDQTSRNLQAINTLSFDTNGPTGGTNTDLIGLREAIAATELSKEKKIAVWGGGGTLDVIRAVFPHAVFYSVRTGASRDGGGEELPDVVIWAAKPGQSAPPISWTPKIIFDLNYSDASPAREYALAKGAKYISGLAMFKAQAKAQRDFWSTNNPGDET